MKLRWDKWIYGLLSGFVGGGASAVICSGSAAILAPDKFNPMTDFKRFIALAGTTFFLNGLMMAFAYLKQSPLPPAEDTIFITKPKDPTEPPTQ